MSAGPSSEIAKTAKTPATGAAGASALKSKPAKIARTKLVCAPSKRARLLSDGPRLAGRKARFRTRWPVDPLRSLSRKGRTHGTAAEYSAAAA